MKTSNQLKKIGNMNDPEKLEQLETTSVWEQEIISAIGLDATLRLEQAFSSSYLYVPAKCPSKEIVNAIGAESGIKLVRYFGCGDIWVPRVLITKYRNMEIIDGINTGKTIKELAAQFNTSYRNINKILSEKCPKK